MSSITQPAISGEATAVSTAVSDISVPQVSSATSAPLRVVVAGGGPAGLRAAQELLRTTTHEIVLLNEERWSAYNRVKLTPFLAGEVQLGQVFQPLIDIEDAPIRHYSSHRVVAIDCAAKTARDQFGRVWPYDKLILATGSRPRLPSVPGIDLPGVFIFRNLDHVESLVARSIRSRRAVIIGGGLLGLEAARGMSGRGAESMVLEHESHLMARQIDARAGALLKAKVEALGIAVRVGVTVREIIGDSRVEAVRLTDGTIIPCDTIVACTGTQPNMELAREAGLIVHRGIVVDSQMRTSDSDVYAVGECAEFDNIICGLVGPSLEQAAVAAAHIAYGHASYFKSVPSTKLKVLGIPVFSIGEVEQLDARLDITTHVFNEGETYRRIVVHRGRLVGALGVGEWPGHGNVQEAVTCNAHVWPWNARRFRIEGDPWPVPTTSVLLWPAAATVCNCTGVTRGQLGDAIAGGCVGIAALQRRTSASTVCGSCMHLLQELIGGSQVYEPQKWSRTLISLSAITILSVGLVLFAGPIRYATIYALEFQIDQLWIDGLFKQVSGFSILGLSLLAVLLSLRKRWRWFSLGNFAHWRLAHVGLGVVMLAVLAVHTGLHLGENLNRWLLVSFLIVSLLGASAGSLIGLEHKVMAAPFFSQRKWSPRKLSTWLHIVVSWPLPLLLMFHILSVYFY